MVVAMVIPALGSQFLQEVLDHILPQSLSGFCLQRFDVRRVTSS
jgi:hypothetical protein